MDSLRGKTLRWTFTDGPAAGMIFEHAFADDGSVTWTIVEGPGKGAFRREKQYAAMQVSDDVCAVSYLAASGHCLTVVLNLPAGRMYAFGSSKDDWHAMTGTFEVVQ
jgi:MoaF N-terminal domain